MHDLPSNRKSCVCHRMVPLQMLYIMALTYIFKVIKFFNVNISKTVRTSNKMHLNYFYWDQYLLSTRTIVNVVLCDLDLNFQGQTFQVTILTSKSWNKSKHSYCHQLRSQVYAIADVVHHDIDSHFQGSIFWNVNILKIVRASVNCSRMTFIEIYICHRMRPLLMLYSMTLTYNFKVKNLKC